jgi:hypothetical protein
VEVVEGRDETLGKSSDGCLIIVLTAVGHVLVNLVDVFGLQLMIGPEFESLRVKAHGFAVIREWHDEVKFV